MENDNREITINDIQKAMKDLTESYRPIVNLIRQTEKLHRPEVPPTSIPGQRATMMEIKEDTIEIRDCVFWMVVLTIANIIFGIVFFWVLNHSLSKLEDRMMRETSIIKEAIGSNPPKGCITVFRTFHDLTFKCLDK